MAEYRATDADAACNFHAVLSSVIKVSHNSDVFLSLDLPKMGESLEKCKCFTSFHRNCTSFFICFIGYRKYKIFFKGWLHSFKQIQFWGNDYYVKDRNKMLKGKVLLNLFLKMKNNITKKKKKFSPDLCCFVFLACWKSVFQ